MSIVKLKLIQLKSPVPYNGVGSLTIHAKDGTLLYDTKNRMVYAKPVKVSTLAKAVIIFTENISFAVPEDDFALEDLAVTKK